MQHRHVTFGNGSWDDIEVEKFSRKTAHDWISRRAYCNSCINMQMYIHVHKN